MLYDNGAFSFEYPSQLVPYSGTYRQENGLIRFDFVANGSSDASGTLNGDLLEVRYNERMVHSDFENAVYDAPSEDSIIFVGAEDKDEMIRSTVTISDRHTLTMSACLI